VNLLLRYYATIWRKVIRGVNQILDRHALKAIGALPGDDHKFAPAPAAVVPEQFEAVSDSLPNTPTSSASVRRSSRPSRLPASNKIFEQIPWKDYPSNPAVEDSSLNLVSVLLALTETQLQSVTPQSVEQALRGKSRMQWLAAMNREKECHIKNRTFGEEWKQSSECPKPVPAGIVFKIKHRGDPIEEEQLKPKQFKARFVIRGQYMKEGLDFNDTFAPVAKPMTTRAVFAIAPKYGCKLKAGDIETAFLSADMDCEVWVKMPPCWGRDDGPITGEMHANLPPRRLLKGVPGIPQGSRLFNEAFGDHLQTMGWRASACLSLPL
ncbi:MAG TPA: reverse transcriptase domain-containing protein, partial [Pirellula sp.]|nr:reverse transcriptase domain-containing protein [Pirellula sp.]